MKTYKAIITVIAAMLAGVSYSHAMYVADTGTFGWNNMDPSIDYLISTPGSGGGSFKSVYGGDIQWTVVSLGNTVTPSFGYYVYDSAGALKSTGVTAVSAGSTATVGLDAGDSVSFYLVDGGTNVNTTGYSNYYGLLGEDVTDFDLVFHSENWDYKTNPYWDTLIVLNGGTAPSGQPLPGVLSSMLIGLGCLGGYRYFRK